MKIRSEDGELEVDVYSKFLFRFWGWMFVAAGLVFLLPMLVQYQISCNEKTPNHASGCNLNTNFLKVYNQNTYLGELKSATVSNFIEGRANTIFYCLLLNTSEGYIKISNISSKKNTDIAYIAEEVDQFVRTGLDNNILIPKVESWFSTLKIVLFLLLGLGSLSFRLITIKFSNKTQTLTIAAENIINTHETKILFSEVDKLIIEEHGKHHKEYSLAIVMKNGEEVHLPGVHDSNLEHIEEIAGQMRPFLEKKQVGP